MGIGSSLIGRKCGEQIQKFVSLIFEARKDDTRNAFLYSGAGDDSVPLEDERLAVIKIDGAGRYAALGVLSQSQGAKPGEKILYSRSLDGKAVATISMLGDGRLLLEADQCVLIKGVDIEVNGAVVATGGSFTCGGSVTPTGEGALCGCKFCYVSGAPVSGSVADGT